MIPNHDSKPRSQTHDLILYFLPGNDIFTIFVKINQLKQKLQRHYEKLNKENAKSPEYVFNMVSFRFMILDYLQDNLF